MKTALSAGLPNRRLPALWSAFMVTLHDYRRRAAVRELLRYHELVQDSRALGLPARAAVPARAPVSARTADSGLHLLLIVLACFVAVHAFAEVRIESVRGNHPSSSGVVLTSALVAPGD